MPIEYHSVLLKYRHISLIFCPQVIGDNVFEFMKRNDRFIFHFWHWFYASVLQICGIKNKIVLNYSYLFVKIGFGSIKPIYSSHRIEKSCKEVFVSKLSSICVWVQFLICISMVFSMKIRCSVNSNQTKFKFVEESNSLICTKWIKLHANVIAFV